MNVVKNKTMKKTIYRVTRQKTVFKDKDAIASDPRIYITEVEAYGCSERRGTSVEITSENIERANLYGKAWGMKPFKIGDVVDGTLRALDFYDDKGDIDPTKSLKIMVGDPFYKVEIKQPDGSFDPIYEQK